MVKINETSVFKTFFTTNIYLRARERKKEATDLYHLLPSSPGLPRVGSGALKHQKWVPPGGSGRCVRAPSRGPGAEPSLGGTDSLAISRTLIAIWWPRVAPSYLSPFSSLRNVLLMSVYNSCLVASLMCTKCPSFYTLTRKFKVCACVHSLQIR